MSDYTPTTEEISIGWAWYKSGWIHSDEIQPQFDRWLAEVKAQAWEEGYIAGKAIGFHDGMKLIQEINQKYQGENK